MWEELGRKENMHNNEKQKQDSQRLKVVSRGFRSFFGVTRPDSHKRARHWRPYASLVRKRSVEHGHKKAARQPSSRIPPNGNLVAGPGGREATLKRKIAVTPAPW